MNFQIIGVKLKRGRMVHIVENQDLTVCRVEIKDVAMNYSKINVSYKICPKCLQRIGSEMLADYIGYDNYE